MGGEEWVPLFGGESNCFVQVGEQHGGVERFLRQPAQMVNIAKMNHLQK
jgi:hypothetical protein